MKDERAFGIWVGSQHKDADGANLSDEVLAISIICDDFGDEGETSNETVKHDEQVICNTTTESPRKFKQFH